MMFDIKKEIQECYNATKDYQNSKNPNYYRGLHDAYAHLLRVIDNKRHNSDSVKESKE